MRGLCSQLDANVSILLYNMRDTSERYNMPDTLKAQYTAHLTKGNVLDTIIYALSIPLKQIPISFSAIGMYFTQSIINFFVPSGSGQATVTMPIMAPLADIIGMTRQTAVVAFQLGDGLTNMIIPTFGTLIIYISIAKVDYKTYIKWVYPLYFMLVGVACVSLLAATAMKLGPF